MAFQFARDVPFPTYYKVQHTPAHTDVFIAGLVTALLIVSISLFAVLPAYNNRKRKALLVRIIVGLGTGGIVLIGNYGPNWEIGTVSMTSPYKPHTHEEIKATLSLHVSLRGRPLLESHNPKNETTELAHERIDYNERFSWEWRQGRFGFGYYAGQISKDFRAATEKGIPLPILQVAEYFTFDGEGIRFGRYYRLSGWYCHLLMWTGFVTWLISNILFCMVVSSGAYFLALTGLLQLTAICIWTFSRNPIEIQIPFQSENEKEDVILSTSFGLDYYLVLANGVFCTLLGLIILALDSCIQDEMCQFFGIDPLTIYDELHLSDDVKPIKPTVPTKSDVSMEISGTPEGPGIPKKVSFYGSTDFDTDTEERQSTVVLKRRTNVGSKIFQRSFRHKPKPAPRSKSPGTLEKNEDSVPFLRVQHRRFVNDSDDDEEDNWPAPPRDSILKMPPLPPPKPSHY